MVLLLDCNRTLGVTDAPTLQKSCLVRFVVKVLLASMPSHKPSTCSFRVRSLDDGTGT